MKIAHIIPYSVILPSTIHNGRYDWLLQLVELQNAVGHEVTIYCSPNSSIEFAKISSIPIATDDRSRNNDLLFEFALQHEHDVFHSHFDWLHYKFSAATTRPIVYTQHYPPDRELIEHNKLRKSCNVWAVPPTEFMLNIDKKYGIQSKGYIHHGINLNEFNHAETKRNNRLLFVGRLTPYKHVEVAMEVAKISGLGLDIVGKVAEKDCHYWNGINSGVDGEKIIYHGPLPQGQLRSFFQNARALIFPSDPDKEAFGLVAIESQACGTPVITQKGGARDELVLNGKTGFLCDTIDDYISVANKVASLNPDDCRNFAKQFDIKAMFQRYNELYESLV